MSLGFLGEQEKKKKRKKSKEKNRACFCCMHHCRDQLTHVITRAPAIEGSERGVRPKRFLLFGGNVRREGNCDEVRWKSVASYFG